MNLSSSVFNLASSTQGISIAQNFWAIDESDTSTHYFIYVGESEPIDSFENARIARIIPVPIEVFELSGDFEFEPEIKLFILPVQAHVILRLKLGTLVSIRRTGYRVSKSDSKRKYQTFDIRVFGVISQDIVNVDVKLISDTTTGYVE